MMSRILYIFLLHLILLCKSEPEFDQYVQSVDSLLRIKVNGYKNVGNSGVREGCCGEKVNRKCLPCKYYVQLLQYGHSFESHEYEEKATIIAPFSKEGEEVYENFTKDILFSRMLYVNFKLQIYTPEYSFAWQDEYPDLNASRFSVYNYNGAYGKHAFIELWAEMILSPITHLPIFWNAMIRIDSIYWRDYRDYSLQCCNGEFSVNCPDACDYAVYWMGFSAIFNETDNLLPGSNIRLKNVGITMHTINRRTQEIDMEYNLKVYSVINRKLIDEIKIEGISSLPNVEYKKLNIKGKYGNLVFNITHTHNCQVWGGINCNVFCEAALSTEFCELTSEQKYCENGATDIDSCTKTQTQCSPFLCKNNGICNPTNKGVVCNCPSGYSGRLCQDWQCDSRCSGNGVCIGPNICRCNFPNTGKNCEEFPCDKNIPDICGIYGTCKNLSGLVHCVCTNALITGETCSTPICVEECVFGACIYNKKLNKTNCTCRDLYQGIHCDVLKETPIDAINFVIYGIPIAIIAILIIIVSVLGILFWKGMIFQSTGYNVIRSNNIEPMI